MKIINNFKIFTLLTTFLFLITANVYSDDLKKENAIENLKILRNSIASLEVERKSLQQKMQSVEGRGREEYFKKEITSISDKIENLNSDFTELVTGVKLDSKSEEQEQKKDLVQELTELLKPIINELKSLTSRPREIDYLKTNVAKLNDDITHLSSGVSSAKKILESVKSKELREDITLIISSWQNELNIKETKRGVLSDKLNDLLGSQKSVLDTVSDVTNLFFKSRGRNLLLALLCAIFFGLFFSGYRKKLEARWATKGLNVRRRFSIVCLDLASVLGSFLIFLLILFSMGDWVLVVITVLLAVGSIWALKHTIPRYWEQTVLLLNMGSVREGERIVYRGIPWLVKRLHFRSTLVNPELTDGRLKLPIKDLLQMRSWKDSGVEPWFPTKINDWILLSDGTFGKVIAQGVEAVVVKLKGGSHRSFPTQEFLAEKPENLSAGFRVSSTVGLDYGLRKKACSDIPAKLKHGIERKLKNYKFKDSDFIISVEFELMDSSSLNFAVIVDFNGEFASDYQKLGRLVQRLALEVCNEQNYDIPFPQMDIHLDKVN